MSIIPRNFVSGVLPALLAVLLLAPTGRAEAQRLFQMGTYVYFSPNITYVGQYAQTANADIAMFGEGSTQPPGLSIMACHSCYNPSGPFNPLNDKQYHYDWTRIVAVLVDEPYDFYDPPPGNCSLSSGYQTIDGQLSQSAATLNSINPKVRFWVNLSAADAEWIATCVDPLAFSKNYIDIISTDWYYVNFGGSLQLFYQYVIEQPATPSQQVALIPGTFYVNGYDNSQYLQSFFQEATTLNQNCNLPLGARGYTGNFDGCQLWMVMGFYWSQATDPGAPGQGLSDNLYGAVSMAWDYELTEAVPPSRPPHPPWEFVPMLNLLMLN